MDLVIKTPKELWAIEVKSSAQVETSHLQGLRSFAQDYPGAKTLCVTPAERSYKTGPFQVTGWHEFFGPRHLNLR